MKYNLLTVNNSRQREVLKVYHELILIIVVCLQENSRLFYQSLGNYFYMFTF